MFARKLIFCGLVAIMPLVAHARPAAVLSSPTITWKPDPAAASNDASRQNLTTVAFDERHHASVQPLPNTPSPSLGPAAAAKPLNQWFDKGLLLLLLAALITHQLRRNQRSLSRHLTGADS